eukprot:scaffold41243_cov107-Isochrysis_galbana.AAC.1
MRGEGVAALEHQAVLVARTPGWGGEGGGAAPRGARCSWGEGGRDIAGWESCARINNDASSPGRLPCAGSEGSHFFSGGLGGLGLLTARLLFDCGARHLILSSRTGRVQSGSEADWLWLSSRAGVQPVCCDVSDLNSLRAVIRRAQANGPPLAGIFHAAG